MKIFDSIVLATRIIQSTREHMYREVRSAILRKRKAWRRWQRSPTKAYKKAYNVASRTFSQALYHAVQS